MSYKIIIMITDPPHLIDISSWYRLKQYHNNGTRSKWVYINPENRLYYFKTSFKRDMKDYPFEFWSEIVASQLGEMLELQVLRYDIAINGVEIGCISPNLLKESEELVDGFKSIVPLYPEFEKNFKKTHSLTKILKVLEANNIIFYKRIIIEMILFDCIIGNTDRHSENWAFIRNNSGASVFGDINKMNFIQRWFHFRKFSRTYGIKYKYKHIKDILARIVYRMADFYDNGSSLGREMNEDRIREMLDSDEAFQQYFTKGKPDIIVSDKKISFLNTIDFLAYKFPNEYSHFVKRHLINYNIDDLQDIINKIDLEFPKIGYDYARLSQARKDFYVKLIDSRIRYIIKIYHERS